MLGAKTTSRIQHKGVKSHVIDDWAVAGFQSAATGPTRARHPTGSCAAGHKDPVRWGTLGRSRERLHMTRSRRCSGCGAWDIQDLCHTMHTRPLPYHARKTSTIPHHARTSLLTGCIGTSLAGALAFIWLHSCFCARAALPCYSAPSCTLPMTYVPHCHTAPHCTTHPHPAQPNFKSSPPNRYTCGRPAENAVDTEQGLCHAVSTDGREWTKPLVGHGNNSGTNRLVTEAFDSALVWQDYTQPVGSPRRWVMSSVPKSLNFSHLRIMQSPDGLNWTVAVKESGLVFFGSLSLSLA